MTLDLDKLSAKSAPADVQYHTVIVSKSDLAALVRIAKASVLTAKYRQSAPEIELLADELREAGLL